MANKQKWVGFHQFTQIWYFIIIDDPRNLDTLRRVWYLRVINMNLKMKQMNFEMFHVQLETLLKMVA